MVASASTPASVPDPSGAWCRFRGRPHVHGIGSSTGAADFSAEERQSLGDCPRWSDRFNGAADFSAEERKYSLRPIGLDCASMGPLISQRKNEGRTGGVDQVAGASMGPLISQRKNAVEGRLRHRVDRASMGPLISQRKNGAGTQWRGERRHASMGPLISQRKNGAA